MMRVSGKAAHFVRKKTQLRASFIRNQITAHVKYEPLLVWRKDGTGEYDGGYARFEVSDYAHLDLGLGEDWKARALFAGPKMLSRGQVEKTCAFLEDRKVDLCHFHYGTDCGIFYPLLKALKIPAVVSFYGYDCSSFPDFLMGYGAAYLKKRVFRDASAVLAMSPDMKRDLLAAGCPEEKIIVHYYGTDCRRFFLKRRYSEKDRLRFLMVASLEPQKGHMFLFQSLMKLRESFRDNWELRLVGVGALEAKLKKFVAQHDLTSNVVFMGGIEYGGQEMMEEYALADIFLHPSVIAANGDKEGIPGTIIEAMAAGLPIVSTHHAGIPYIMENEKTGLLCREWDVDCLTACLRRLCEDKRLRAHLGKAAQDYAMKHLDLNEKEKELERIYGQLTGQTKSVPLSA